MIPTCHQLRMLDYEFVFEVLNAKNYGVPQSRPRLYLMAVCRESVQHGLVMPPAREDQPDLHTFLDKSPIDTATDTATST